MHVGVGVVRSADGSKDHIDTENVRVARRWSTPVPPFETQHRPDVWTPATNMMELRSAACTNASNAARCAPAAVEGANFSSNNTVQTPTPATCAVYDPPR